RGARGALRPLAAPPAPGPGGARCRGEPLHPDLGAGRGGVRAPQDLPRHHRRLRGGARGPAHPGGGRPLREPTARTRSGATLRAAHDGRGPRGAGAARSATHRGRGSGPRGGAARAHPGRARGTLPGAAGDVRSGMIHHDEPDPSTEGADMTEVRELGSHVRKTVTVRGWVEATRGHGQAAFLVARGGTGLVLGVLLRQGVDDATWERHGTVGAEAVVAVTGEVRAEPRAPGGYELGVTGLEVLAEARDYPIQPKEHGVDFLLDHRHLWLRSSQQRAGLRVRAEVEQAVHDFFYDRGFVRIDTPILTGAIGEHAGTLFETDYFGEPAFLAQTGQLYVEAACPAFRKVYCFGPTFRAEKSKTRRHLTEFWMVEPEVAFADSNDNMRLQEEFVSYLVERALERCAEELKV